MWGHVNVVESCFLAATGTDPSWAPCCDSRRVSDGCRCPRHAAVQELHKVRGLAGCVGRCNTVAAQHRNAGRWARLGGVVARESLHREPWTRPRASQAPGARVAHRAGAVLRRVGPSNPRAHKRHTSCGGRAGITVQRDSEPARATAPHSPDVSSAQCKQGMGRLAPHFGQSAACVAPGRHRRRRRGG